MNPGPVRRKSVLLTSRGGQGFAMGCAALTLQEDFHDKYALGKKIGAGSYGQVRATWERSTLELRAVKVVAIQTDSGVTDKRHLKTARQESLIWQRAGSHPNVIKLYESMSDDCLYYMVMEKCEASLMDRLGEMNRMGEAGIARIFCEMLSGIAHVHSRRVVHRDVKPDNFLMGGEDGRTVKLCDFGMAAMLPQQAGELPGCFGTAPYMSPEMVASTGHLQSTDIWSFAATAYVLLYGDFPYQPVEKSSKAMKQAILLGEPAPSFTREALPFVRPPSTSAECFVKVLLERSPGRRQSAEQALQLPFLRQDAGSAAIPAVAFTAGPVATEGDQALDPVIRRARLRTREFKPRIEPTVQRSVDEILRRLQYKDRCHVQRCFSSPAGSRGEQDGEQGCETALCRRFSKSKTFSGELQCSRDEEDEEEESGSTDEGTSSEISWKSQDSLPPSSGEARH